MRFLTLFFLAILLVTPAWAGEKKSEAPAQEKVENTDAAPEKTQDKKQDKEKDQGKQDEVLSTGDVSEQMAEVWCDKLAECGGTQEMSPKECRKVLKDSFNRGFKNTAKGQKVEVTQGTLTQCNESIRADTCESLKSAQKLPGCEFINLLNRG